MEWAGVQPDQIEKCWQIVEPMLRKAIELTPGYTAENVLERLVSGQFQLWVALDREQIFFALVTEFRTHPEPRVHLDLLGGTRWLEGRHLLSVIFKWANSLGAKALLCYPRKGVAKYLKEEFGFKWVGKNKFGDLYFRDLKGCELNLSAKH